MRTLIDIPDTEIRALAALCERTRRPRAALVRQAIRDYVKKHEPPALEAAFGLWGPGATSADGVMYQRKVRAEW